jgi:hypothetical protein
VATNKPAVSKRAAAWAVIRDLPDPIEETWQRLKGWRRVIVTLASIFVGLVALFASWVYKVFETSHTVMSSGHKVRQTVILWERISIVVLGVLVVLLFISAVRAQRKIGEPAQLAPAQPPALTVNVETVNVNFPTGGGGGTADVPSVNSALQFVQSLVTAARGGGAGSQVSNVATSPLSADPNAQVSANEPGEVEVPSPTDQDGGDED